jgi:hypothetical protein
MSIVITGFALALVLLAVWSAMVNNEKGGKKGRFKRRKE